MTKSKASSAGITHSTGEFKGVRDTVIRYQQWIPAKTAPRAAILIVHGIGEHGGRYSALAEDFIRAGFAVGCPDHRGHGKSEGKRAQVDKFDDFADDLDTYYAILRKQFPAPLPLFIVAHSMGGLIALRYVTRDKPDATGLVLSGAAAAKPEDISDLTITIGNILAKVLPDVGVAGLQFDKISRDPAVVEAYTSDPLVTTGKIRARMGAELLAGMDTVEKDLPTLTTPILIMHGGDDVITPPHGSEMIYAEVGSKDKTLKIYDGLYHEVYNEPEREEVIADVITWIDAQIASS